MSHERKIEWLNEQRIIYRQTPINDIPTVETDKYMFFEAGTYEYYCLFNTKAKITTYKSMKWHFLVLYYLNQDRGLLPSHVYEFIANKDNGFVTFFISDKKLQNMIDDVFNTGGEPPRNKLRKVIFKYGSGLSKEDKLKVKNMHWTWNGLFSANTRIKDCHFVHFFLKDKLPEAGENVEELMKQI